MKKIISLIGAAILAFATIFSFTGCQTFGERDLAVKLPIVYATLNVINDDVERAQQVYDVTILVQEAVQKGIISVIDIDKIINDQVNWEKLSTADTFLALVLIDEIKVEINKFVEAGKISEDHQERVSVILGYVLQAARMSGAQ